MAGLFKRVKAFQFKGILVILGCFLLMGAILFAERSGLSYRERKKELTYLDADEVVTEETAVRALKTPALFLWIRIRRTVSWHGNSLSRSLRI